MVSPAYTAGLAGKPNELKLKFLADNDFADLSGEALQEAIRQEIKAKNADLVGDMSSEGTTPRQYTDLLGSLCDQTSGPCAQTPRPLSAGEFTFGGSFVPAPAGAGSLRRFLDRASLLLFLTK